MDLLKPFKRNKILALLLLLLSPASQALVCNGAGCQCSATFGIGFVQGTDGTGSIPNFELAVPHTGGGFSAYYRNNHIQDPERVLRETWLGPQSAGWGDINGIAMLENAVTNPSGPIPPVPGNGNLEVITIQDGSLYHYWRDRNTKAWSSGTWIGWGFTGQPGFTQSKDWHENFEVVVPRQGQGGGLAHYWRDNSIPSMPWHGPTVFAQGFNFEAVSLVESNFDNGNLEVVARAGQTLYHIWRGNDLTWSAPREIRVDGNNPIQATGVHSFVQGTSGNKGDFELVVPLLTGGLMHYSRNNDTTVGGFYPWSTVGWVDEIHQYSAAGLIVSDSNNLQLVSRRSEDGALVAFSSNESYDEWNVKTKNSSGQPVWAGTVFGGEPCCDPVTKGRWQNPYNSGAIGIHAALLPNSKVLFFGFADNNDMGYSEIFNPADGSSTQPIVDPDEPIVPHAFCSGHTLMSNGTLWVAGGHDAPGHEPHIDDSHLFYYDESRWDKPDAIQLQTGRWYPTLARLENGDVLVISGAKEVGRTPVADEVNLFWQILNSTGTSLSGEDASRTVPNPFDPDETGKNFLQLYPFVFQLPDGRVFVHSYRTSRFFSPLTSNTWSPTKYVTQYEHSRTYPGYGSAVLMPLSPDDGYRARVMLFGGGGNVSNAAESDSKDTTVAATNTVELLDLGADSPKWTTKKPMNHPRVLNNAVLLPDGKVFVVGGSTHGSSDHAGAPVMTPEIYDPGDPDDPDNPREDSWTEMCPMRVARLYHSTALLLPDARVLTAGRDHAWNEDPYKWPERRVEIFSPPYLESGNPRPVIQSVNDEDPVYGQSFTVTLNSAVSASNIGSAVLMAPGAVTHGFDQGQRAVKLTINTRSGNTLTLTAPPNGRVTPPGYYMLFVVSNQGVPSVAKFINVH